MKKSLFLVLFLALMGGAFAQNEGVTEYVSALITFKDGSNVPQDSLNKYGVVIQTRSGRMATALIAAQQYQACLNAQLVERVQPSTRVFMRNDQVKADGAYVETPYQKNVKAQAKNVEDQDRRSVRRNMIPEEDIRRDEAKGWYVGLLLGGTSNSLDVQKTIFNGTWYSYRGLNLELRAGYQFNEWFGIRSGVGLLSKNYATKLTVDINGASQQYNTYHQNQYLQLPLMADFSIGGEAVRIHFMAGGYAAYWLSQYRDGYIYKATEPHHNTGYTYQFIDGYDNRFDAGLACGLGLSMNVSPNWQLLFEGNYYHGLISTAKSPSKMFNRTWNFGMGVTYHF